MGTRKEYILQGEEFEKNNENEKALQMFIKAFDIKDCSDNDEIKYFMPSYIEDRIAFLAYRLGEYELSVTYGEAACNILPDDTRLRDNLAFYKRGLDFINSENKSYSISKSTPKTFIVGIGYFNQRKYGLAIGIFEDSLEKMSKEYKSLMNYYCGLSYLNLNKTLEALKNFAEAVETCNFKDAYYEIFKILEKLEFWEDSEYYLRKALKHKDEECWLNESSAITNWEGLLMIQLSLALWKQNKRFESYGSAQAAANLDLSKGQRVILESNIKEIENVLWSEIQE